MEQEYIEIGRQCGVAEPNTTNVKSWLACNNQRWLMIIDNADDPEIDYSKYLPSGAKGDILITTRNPECATVYNTVGFETLDNLELDLAKLLLFRAIHVPEEQWEEKEKDAIAVASVLGSHTLAIIQAGAFIRSKLCSLKQYPTLFQQQKKQLLQFHWKQDLSQYGDVYTTFEVSAVYLQNRKSSEGQNALSLLHILSFMHNNGVHETVFQKAYDYAYEIRNSEVSEEDELFILSRKYIGRLPEYAQPGPSSFQDSLGWRQACVLLESLSLVSLILDGESIIILIHPLVHAWAKERQNFQNQSEAWRSAATILALSCHGWYRYHSFFVVLEPHVRACISHEVVEYTRDLHDMETAQILFQFAHVLFQSMSNSSLDVLVEQIRLRLEHKPGINQPIASRIKLFKARVKYNRWDFGEAIAIIDQALQARKESADDDHDRLILQYELAMAYWEIRKFDKAIALFEHVVRIREKEAEDNRDRLNS